MTVKFKTIRVYSRFLGVELFWVLKFKLGAGYRWSARTFFQTILKSNEEFF